MYIHVYICNVASRIRLDNQAVTTLLKRMSGPGLNERKVIE